MRCTRTCVGPGHVPATSIRVVNTHVWEFQDLWECRPNNTVPGRLCCMLVSGVEHQAVATCTRSSLDTL